LLLPRARVGHNSTASTSDFTVRGLAGITVDQREKVKAIEAPKIAGADLKLSVLTRNYGGATDPPISCFLLESESSSGFILVIPENV